MEEYVETIFVLEKKEGAAHTGKIAEVMGVKPPSVTEMLRKLQESGFVKYKPFIGANLTSSGREKARELMKNDSCLKNCLTYKQANNETIEKKKKEIYQLEQFSGLIKEFSPPSDNITEEDKIYLQLLTRLSSHKKAPHDDMTIDSIINEISLATKAINKCRNCHKEILTIESNVKENNQIIFS